MKILQLSQKNFEGLGISYQQSIQDSPFNARNSKTLVLFGLSIVLAIAYIFGVANGFEEYIASFYLIICLITNSVLCAIFVWKMPKLFESIQNLERIIGEREENFKYFYFIKLNKLIKIGISRREKIV